MAPAAFGTVYLLLALIAFPQVLAESSCSHDNHGKRVHFKKCRNNWGSEGYNTSNFSWPPVNTGSGGNHPHSVPPTACGSNTTPKNSGTSPTPEPTSTSPPPAANPSTPTSTPRSPSPSSSPLPSTTGNEDPGFTPPPVDVSNPSNQSVPATDSIKEEALKAHNDFRALHGASPLVWDDTVANYAVNWTSGCVFEHSGGPYGENLAVGTGPFTVTDGINMWTGEAGDYDPKNPTYSHFTQVVWKASTHLGCAFATCPPGSIYPEEYGNALLLSCNYNPPGNVIGQFEENVQP